jgi:hypothetical protein
MTTTTFTSPPPGLRSSRRGGVDLEVRNRAELDAPDPRDVEPAAAGERPSASASTIHAPAAIRRGSRKIVWSLSSAPAWS